MQEDRSTPYKVEVEKENETGRQVLLDKCCYEEARAEFESYKNARWNKYSEPGDIIILSKDGDIIDQFEYNFDFKIVVMDQRKDFSGDVHLQWCDSVEEGLKAAQEQWDHLTDREKKERVIQVARIAEDCLNDKDDWESFHSYDALFLFDC